MRGLQRFKGSLLPDICSKTFNPIPQQVHGIKRVQRSLRILKEEGQNIIALVEKKAFGADNKYEVRQC